MPVALTLQNALLLIADGLLIGFGWAIGNWLWSALLGLGRRRG